jgi:hypothetical protein
VGGKSADEVRRYYELLEKDLEHIEAGKVPFPAYRCPGGYDDADSDRYGWIPLGFRARLLPHRFQFSGIYL